jgi:hypothetical protein
LCKFFGGFLEGEADKAPYDREVDERVKDDFKYWGGLYTFFADFKNKHGSFGCVLAALLI